MAVRCTSLSLIFSTDEKRNPESHTQEQSMSASCMASSESHDCAVCRDIHVIQCVVGCRAKLYNRKRYAEKIQMKKRIKMHEQRQTKNKEEGVVPKGAVPAYLLDREGQSRAKVLSNMVKQKRKEKAVSLSTSD